MPLEKSGSKAAVGRNIEREEAAGKKHSQAVAIALKTQREASHDSKSGRYEIRGADRRLRK